MLKVQLTTSITETSITNPTRITNEMATSNDYLLKYFNGFLAMYKAKSKNADLLKILEKKKSWMSFAVKIYAEEKKIQSRYTY